MAPLIIYIPTNNTIPYIVQVNCFFICTNDNYMVDDARTVKMVGLIGFTNEEIFNKYFTSTGEAHIEDPYVNILDGLSEEEIEKPIEALCEYCWNIYPSYRGYNPCGRILVERVRTIDSDEYCQIIAS